MAENHIEVDSQGSGEDDSYSDYSDYSSGLESDLTSLVSTAKNHTYENGRRFHGYKQGAYGMPNDEAEQDRLDLAHHYHSMALRGKLYTAPIKDTNPQRILDLGTGTGIWCIDMGDEFPSAEVFGVDLSPIQPQWVPPNVNFEVDDIREEWQWPDNYFDFIHIRQLTPWLSKSTWEHVVKQAWRCLKPGGYIEMQDLTDFFHCDDGTLPADSVLTKWVEYAEEAVNREEEKPWLNGPEVFRNILTNHGYDDIKQTDIKCPIGQWAKNKYLRDMGTYARQMKYDGAESFTLILFTKVLGWDMERFRAFADDIRKELFNPRYHTYERFYCIYARKPS